MSLDFYLEMKVDTGNVELQDIGLFSTNMTHNLNQMASKAGLYECLWNSKENEYKKAKDIIDFLKIGIDKLEKDPSFYKKFNPENGWGDYDGLLKTCKEILEACKEHPKASIVIWK